MRSNQGLLSSTSVLQRLLALFMLTALLTTGCGDNLDPGPRTIGDYVRSEKRFTSLEGLLEQAGLLETFDAPGAHTLFAPTDDAFEALLIDPSVPSRDWLALPKLAELLRYHIVEGSLDLEALERVTAVATLEGPEIHVRLTLDGLMLNDGVKIDSEVIETENGMIYVLDQVLVRPLITTTTRYESAPGLPLTTEGGIAFTNDYQILTNTELLHDLRVFIDIKHPDVSQLYVYLSNRRNDAQITLVGAPRSDLDDIDLTFQDSAEHDIINDVVYTDDPDAQAFPEKIYRPIVPLESLLGKSLEGEWELTVIDFRDDPSEEGMLVRWGFIATTSPQAPAPAIVFNRRNIDSRVFGRGFTESLDINALRVAGLSGEMELSGSAGEVVAETRTLAVDSDRASLLLAIASDASMGVQEATVAAKVGSVSRVMIYDATIVEPDASGMELLAHVPLPLLGAEGSSGNDIWGWTDPLTGAEIALVGTAVGTTFVDVTIPEAPVVLGSLATATEASDWRDVKVYKDHAFIVSEAEDHGMQIFDLTLLRDVSAPQSFAASAHSTEFGNAHNIAIDEDTGFAYVVGSNYDNCHGGLLIYDISTPLSPRVEGCFAGGVPPGRDPGPSYPTDVYIHDVQCLVYAGPDTAHVGREICISSDEHTVGIVDVSNKSAPAQLSRLSYEGVGYTHQGWLTEDHQYFILNDEFDEVDLNVNTRTYVFDMRDLDAPVLLGSIDNPRDAIGHNTYIKGNTAFQANYTSGLRLMDLSDIASGTGQEAAYYDTYPDDDAYDGRPGSMMSCHPSNSACGQQSYQGAWSNYPYFASGVIIVSDIDRGLFVLRAN